jgi:hypothetical protein
MSQDEGLWKRKKKTTLGKIQLAAAIGSATAILVAIADILNMSISVLDRITRFGLFFLMFTYFASTFLLDSYETIYSLLTGRFLRFVKTLRWWFFAFFAWAFSLPFMNILAFVGFWRFVGISYASYALLVWLYLFYPLIILGGAYSLMVSIPVTRFLGSLRIEKEKKGKIARALSILIPILGAPWILGIFYSILLLGIINDLTPIWVIYLIIFGTYLAFFFFLVDLPYSVSIWDKKKVERRKLKYKRKASLTDLKKIGRESPDDIARRILLESEIARIDRDLERVESEPSHPFKIVIPIASFAAGLVAPLLVEILKKLVG